MGVASTAGIPVGSSHLDAPPASRPLSPEALGAVRVWRGEESAAPGCFPVFPWRSQMREAALQEHWPPPPSTGLSEHEGLGEKWNHAGAGQGSGTRPSPLACNFACDHQLSNVTIAQGGKPGPRVEVGSGGRGSQRGDTLQACVLPNILVEAFSEH